MQEFRTKRVLFALTSIIVLSISISMLFDGMHLYSSWSHFLKTISYGCSFGVLFWSSSIAISYWIRIKGMWKKNPRRAPFISLLFFTSAGIIISLSVPYVYLKYVFHVSQPHLKFEVLFTAFLTLSVDMIMVSFMFSKYLVKYWMESMQNEEKLKQEKLIAQFESLKNQVNPHFLFNSLNTLTGVVEQNPGEAVPFIKKLSDNYRYVLEQKDRDVVPLHEELVFVQDYIYLMQMRHGNGLKIAIDLTGEEGYIAPLALQMLVENTIKHNAISDDTPLRVNVQVENQHIVIRNNKQVKTILATKKPEGLENLERRYAFLSDKKLEIIDTDTEFVVKLPLLEKPVE